MLIINSYETALELLGNRSAIYSSRPHLVMTADLGGWDWLSIIAPYGERLRKLRTYQHQFFNSPDTLNFLDSQLIETRRTIKGILDNPDEYAKHIDRLPGALVMMNVYGHRISAEDRFVNLGISAIKSIADSAEQYFLLDFFPWLKYVPEWFPYSNFHQVAKEARKLSHAFRHELHDLTKKRMAEGTARECMTTTLLTDNACDDDGSINEEDVFRDAAATVFLGGVQSSSAAILTFVLGMLKNPDAQRRGQSEIDRVVGTDRLPSFEDKENLPYVHAIYEETLRYASNAPLGFPHLTTADDDYKGFHIPAGTTVMANQWAMSYNPEIHEDPLGFNPERWLPREDDGEGRGPLPHNYVFGFGRRACVGQKWAEHLLFITIATMLAAFNLEKAIDEDGRPIEPNDQYVPGFARALGPSKCRITPRSQKVVSLIEQSFDEN